MRLLMIAFRDSHLRRASCPADAELSCQDGAVTGFKKLVVRMRDSWVRTDQPLATAFVFGIAAMFASLAIIVSATWDVIDHFW